MSSPLVAHGIKRLGVLGAGQMGTGIAMVSAVRAKVPVLIYDRSPAQITKGLALMDKLLAKDVGKGRLTAEQAREARGRVEVVGEGVGMKGLRDVDMVVEVRPSSSLYLMGDLGTGCTKYLSLGNIELFD